MVLAVVGISGCTDSTPANKTYSANGVTFVYPGNWSELNKTAYQSEVNNTEILFVVGNNQTHLTLGKFVLGSNEVLYTLQEWAQVQNSSIPSGVQYLSEKTLTIAGVDAYQMRYKGTDGDYVITGMYFIKNNTGYLMTYVSRYEETQTLDNILNSFKMP